MLALTEGKWHADVNFRGASLRVRKLLGQRATWHGKENVTPNMYVPNNLAAKHIRQKPVDPQVELDESTLTHSIGCF